MKRIAAAIFLISVIISFIGFLFTVNQVRREEERLELELQSRSLILAENLRNAVEPYFTSSSSAFLNKTLQTFADKDRFAGIGLYDNKGSGVAEVAVSPLFSEAELSAEHIVTGSMDENSPKGGFVKIGGERVYAFSVPLREGERVVGSILLVEYASYIDARLGEIWQNNILRFVLQAFVVSIAIVFVIRWVLTASIRGLVESVQSIRAGVNSERRFWDSGSFPFLAPLVREISKLGRSLTEARLVASEEARLRLEQVDSPWTKERLKEFVKDSMKGRTLYVVSNREPYIHTHNGNKITYYVPVSGMVTAIEPMMQSFGGTWIAAGSGDADQLTVDKHDSIAVPPDEPRYRLRRVWLTKEANKGYYDGFCNEGLWPLCHFVYARPVFRQEDFAEYKRVNGMFTQVVLQEIKHIHKPIVFVQDFHLALLPRLIKKSRPDAVVGLFWHIPWPNPEAFSVCPFRKDILYGMLGADLIGFHTQLHCNNFIATIGRELESLIDWEQFTVTRGGHVTHIKSFPISIAFSNGYEYQSHDQSVQLGKRNIGEEFGIKAKYIGLGVDRMDYTKGITDRLRAVELFLVRYPSYRKHFVFIQIAPQSRSGIQRYQDLDREVTAEVERVNERFKTAQWKPIILLKKRFKHEELNRFYRLAHICVVTSLHDGMNLVAKEFVAARDDERGVLIVSQFAGASRELREALIVNPYDIDQVADAIREGLDMPKSKQRARMRRLRETVRNHNVYRWSAEILKTLISIE